MLINAAGHEPNIELKLGDNVIPATGHVKDPGELTDNQLTFITRINHAVAKAFARASLISKCFSLKDTIINTFACIQR
jgi:hypothetical protein